MIDRDSPSGSYRHALAPDGPSCAACGQNVCGHSDIEYQWLTPPMPPAAMGTGAAVRVGSFPAAAAPASALSSPFHACLDSAVAQRNHG